MNTRSGSYELLAGGSIGRFASLAAALVTAAIGVVGVGVVTVPALIGCGFAGQRLTGLWIGLGCQRAGLSAWERSPRS